MFTKRPHHPLDALFSSVSTEWRTPTHLARWAVETYALDLDVASTPENAVCRRRLDDGLVELWDGRCFMNPPWGRRIGLWTVRARYQVAEGIAPIVVCVIPANTENIWFHDLVATSDIVHADVSLLRGRVQYLKADGSPSSRSTVATAIVVLTRPPRSKA